MAFGLWIFFIFENLLIIAKPNRSPITILKELCVSVKVTLQTD